MRPKSQQQAARPMIVKRATIGYSPVSKAKLLDAEIRETEVTKDNDYEF